MNLFSYIDKYGCYSFLEFPFCEVDNLVFASLSYLSLEEYVSKTRFSKMSIGEVGKLFFERYSKKEKNVLGVRQAIKVFRAIYETKRYKDLLLYNYVYCMTDEEQFSAVTIEISKKLVYVSFEGTDQSIGGWKENFMLSYQFPVLSQRRAIDYVNKHFLFRNQEIILGGHSKGGNLALVAGMYANFLVRDKIILVYNNDGPGLLPEQINSKYYKYVSKKLVHIVPNYSLVGMMLLHDKNYVVVRSFRKSILAHDINTWVVNSNYLERAELSHFSQHLESEMQVWLNQYDLGTREKFVQSLFMVFEKADVHSLLEIMERKTVILSILREIKGIDKETSKIIREFLMMVFKCFKDITKEEFLGLFDKN